MKIVDFALSFPEWLRYTTSASLGGLVHQISLSISAPPTFGQSSIRQA